MNESPIGKSIRDAFLFLKQVFADTARLLSLVEGTMNEQKFTAKWGAASVWDRSYAYYGDYGWLVHYLTRLYVKNVPVQEKQDERNFKGVFFNVYFSPKLVTQPVVVYGFIESNEEKIWPVWKFLFTNNDGPAFITEERVDEWVKYPDGNHPDLVSLIYKVRPLVEFNNKEMVEATCKDIVAQYT